MDRKELIERLEKLERPDREIDCLIWAHFDGRTVRESDRFILARSTRPPHDECVLGTIDPGEYSRNFQCEGYHNPPVPAYTASLDAAIALVEKMRPGWTWGAGTTDMEQHPFAAQVRQKGVITSDHDYSFGPTPAIALLLALLRFYGGRVDGTA
ncbi:hypothetical protein [Mesorhizobium sp. Z1-4]|uniref:hypothetical protein n=1 Tax=Mesorhizobium sp. Z1-4 TaxID=2448478 RepID=UPI000FD8C24A|nr:hypothetical protein [Mesorhizobium sp. Z1-4]